MNELKLKPILIVNDIIFEKIKKNQTLLVNLYGDTTIKEGKVHDVELETYLTLLFNVLNRDELESVIYDSKLLMEVINKNLLDITTLKSSNLEFLNKFRKVSNVYNDVVGSNNENLNKNVLTEVKKNYLLDLKTRYSILTKEDMQDLGNFIVLKVCDKMFYMLKSMSVNNEVFNMLYGTYLNTNSITSNTDFNNKIGNNILGSVMPYIKTMHSNAV